MSKFFWNALKQSSALLGATLLLANSAQAGEVSAQPNQNNQAPDALAQVTPVSQLSAPEKSNTLSQVTSVSQLSDVQPTDWAFQALQSLVERYGVIAGYPDGTYRGNRALTRYEFAAGLNAALDRINELIAAGTADLVRKKDLATLQRLQEEFAAELATLRGRVDSLEARTAELEANQFSTTTKLNGEVIIAVAGAFGDEGAGGEDIEENVILADRVRLNFDTSFFGDDLLRTRLQARNVTPFSGDVTGTNMTRLSFDGNDENNVELDKLFYRFNVGEIARVQIDANAGEFYENFYNFNPALASSGVAISRYGRFSPIYRQGNTGAGASVTLFPEKTLSFSAGYLAIDANNPTEGAGLFNGSYSAIGQVAFRPSERLNVGFTYARTYRNEGDVSLFDSTGSSIANDPFDGAATTSDNFGLQGNFQLTNKLTLGAWGGYTKAQELNTDDEAEIWYWAATAALQDFGKEGNLLGLVFGQPPRAGSVDGGPDDGDTSYHLEGLYRYQLTDNIAITPGVLVIFNPEHDSDNDNIYVGTIRTTFTF